MGYDQRRIDSVKIIFFQWNNYDLDNNRKFNVRVWYICMWYLGWIWIASKSFTIYPRIDEIIISSLIEFSTILNLIVIKNLYLKKFTDRHANLLSTPFF